jgi:urease accessory protein
VPHESSVFTSKTNIHLAENCSLTWGEVLTCGRKLSGESFLFSKYHSLTQVFQKNKLVVKENLLMAPKLIDVNSLGQLEGCTHQASLIFIDETVSPTEASNAINELLGSEKEICFGVSALPVNGLIVRILGYKGEQLHSLLKRLAVLVAEFSSTPKPVVYAK